MIRINQNQKIKLLIFFYLVFLLRTFTIHGTAGKGDGIHLTPLYHFHPRYFNTSDLVKKTDYNTKITEIEGKLPDVANLATKAALTTVKNKIPDVSSLVKKTDYDTKVTEIENKLNNHNHDKYITTTEFNTLTVDIFNARLSQADLVTKTSFDNTVSSLNSKIVEYKKKMRLVKMK